jgi:hypothetical protein
VRALAGSEYEAGRKDEVFRFPRARQRVALGRAGAGASGLSGSTDEAGLLADAGFASSGAQGEGAQAICSHANAPSALARAGSVLTDEPRALTHEPGLSTTAPSAVTHE